MDIITIIIVSIVVGEVYLLLLMNIIMYIINVRYTYFHMIFTIMSMSKKKHVVSIRMSIFFT
jgi:hypothetical protein